MADFYDKFLLPIVTGTLFGFLINWTLEYSRRNARRNRILASLQTYIYVMPRFNTFGSLIF